MEALGCRDLGEIMEAVHMKTIHALIRYTGVDQDSTWLTKNLWRKEAFCV